jgi:integrase
MGLGGLQTVSLTDAREKAASFRSLARRGGDPVEERRKALRTVPLFREAALKVHAEHSGAWKNPKHRSTASPIRRIFKEAFNSAGLPYFNPHSFRKTLVQLGEQTCRTPEEFKAWSQNLGHEGVLTTFSSYGTVANRRQAEIIRALGKSKDEHPAQLLDLVRELSRVTGLAL